jgi:hypothetical protein
MSDKAQLASKQKTFIGITQAIIITSCVIGIANCVYFFPTFFKTMENINKQIKNIPGPDKLAAYFKNHGVLEDDCLSFDGHSLTVKAPMTLSDLGLPKVQFKEGVKLNGLTISPTDIELTKVLLFNNNLDIVDYHCDPNSCSGWYLNAGYDSHFFGSAGLTEIGSTTPGSQCTRQSPIGSGNNPFPGMYVKTNVGNTYSLCLCTENWIYRTQVHTPGTLTYALLGSGTYNTPGEYCVPLS